MLSLIHPRYKIPVYMSMITTGLALLTLFQPWEYFKIIGLTILTGVSYGIISDLISCHECIEYFTLGHHYDERNLRYRLVQSLNPIYNAIIWGIFATWHLSLFAGIILASVARLSRQNTSFQQIMRYLIYGSGIIFIISHIGSYLMKKKMQNSPYIKYLGVPLNIQASWEACTIRNMLGYILFIGGTMELMVII